MPALRRARPVLGLVLALVLTSCSRGADSTADPARSAAPVPASAAADLERATAPAHRQMLQQALAAIDEQLSRF